ncbi:MAG: bifunctional folylpolyglutamate synthase/dihydrofolate synthase [Flavobacteriales bacterium]
MSYNEVLKYLYEQLPMFHRIGTAAYKPGLDTTHALLRILGHPHHHLKFVHVAGTNGKGSTSHLIASALQEAGYKTGLYTSPHLKDFRERIRFNGIQISESDVVEFVETYHRQWADLRPSFFELTVGMAFWFFRKMKTEICVIEVGLGGRLDSTNVISPEVSVITNIGLDHTNLLGDTIAKIAAEKAGIIKPNVPAVVGKMLPEALAVMKAKALAENAPLTDASLCDVSLIPATSLQGAYQAENKATAFCALENLRLAGWHILPEHIAAGFMHVVQNTGLQGRWQVLQSAPLCIADVAHNTDGITQVVQQLETMPYDQLHMVIGMVADKDIDHVLALLPADAHYYFCAAAIPRALPAAQLQQRAAAFGLHGMCYSSVAQSFVEAKKQAASSDLVLVTGSVFVVGEVV